MTETCPTPAARAGADARRIVAWPFGLLVLPAALAGSAPELFLWSREAIARGEWWRLFTGHWVHFSGSHAGWNLLVLGVAGAALEWLRPGALARYTLLAAALIGAGLWWLAPAMHTYGGLSGIATGAVALLALTWAEREVRVQPWCYGALALIAGKLAGEAATDLAFFASWSDVAIRPSAAAHVLGAAAAALFYVGGRLTRPSPAASR